MDELLKNIIKKVIQMKEQEIQEYNFKDMSEEGKKEHDEKLEEIVALEKELQKSLGEDQWKLVSKYYDAIQDLNCIEQHYMFKQGVEMGLTDLHFIREELKEATVFVL